MSIFRQFWLAIIGLTLLAFIGSFLVSLYSARAYLAQQLYIKNADNAAALALVLSQLPDKDPVTVELLISAQFDTGHYQEIVLSDPGHRTILERRDASQGNGAPRWFVEMFPIHAAPGVALVQDGWKQYGSVKLVSHSRFAYQELWNGVRRLALWFGIAGLAAGLAGTAFLRLLLRPLNKVVDQAQAIQERRFVAVNEPKTPELRTVVTAMNAMVERLKAIFSEEATRLEALRQQVHYDPLTGLPNRDFFLTRLSELLQGEESARTGCMAIVRIVGLDRLNAQLGHHQTDMLIQDLADILAGSAEKQGNGLPARLNGSDFAVLAPGASDPDFWAAELHAEMEKGLRERWPQVEDIFHAGVIVYRHGDEAGSVLAEADKSLAHAESRGANVVHAASSGADHTAHRGFEAWRQALTEAIAQGRMRLERYPVVASDNRLLHVESAARIQLDSDGAWLPAGDFMPMVLRQHLSSALDLGVLRIALEWLDHCDGDIAVNLSAETIADWRFNDELTALFGREPAKCRRLWLEVPEYGMFRNFDAFRSFCRRFDSFGCKLGIEHFGQHLNEIARLAELGLDYLKVDSQYIRGIDGNTGNQEFLRGLCRVAHNAGVLVLAENVCTEAEMRVLGELGFDGATGEEITRRMGGA